MSRIRKTDSKPELILRAALRKEGVRFRTYATLPGTPDLAVPDARIAVFVHGCFWHGCPHHYRRPRSNLEYWIPKLERNQRRDSRNARQLRAAGWSVMVAWECKIRENAERVAIKIAKAREKRLLASSMES